MATPLLKTKFYIPPPRPNLVSCPRLIQRLDGGLRLGHRITLLSARAGFGKTTLLSEWIASSERSVAWVSLDEGDNDPVRFLTYLVGALQGVDEGIGQSVEGTLQSPQLPSAATTPTDQAAWIEAPTAALIGDVTTAARALVLVLDDYHLISAAPVHRILRFLMEHQPRSMHIVISTREDPPLSLPRLRVRGHMTEIRERLSPSTGHRFHRWRPKDSPFGGQRPICSIQHDTLRPGQGGREPPQGNRTDSSRQEQSCQGTPGVTKARAHLGHA